MGKRTISGGVVPAGNRIRFDLRIDGNRFRPTVRWFPDQINLKRARERMLIYRAQIAAGTFSFTNSFPEYRCRKRLGLAPQTLTCSEVFDRFLAHCEARVSRDDLAPSTAASYRQILNHTWRPKIGRLPFLAVRYSTLEKVADAQKCVFRLTVDKVSRATWTRIPASRGQNSGVIVDTLWDVPE